MVMDDDDGIHPLDRDYSIPSKPAKNRFFDLSRSHQIGILTFASGFATVLLAAVTLGASPGGGWVETVGSFMHRLAMYMILVGGVLIVYAYQAPRYEAAALEREQRLLKRGRANLRQHQYQDPKFGSLTLLQDDQGARLIGRVVMWRVDPVSVAIEVPRDVDKLESSVCDLAEQAWKIFVRIRKDQSAILAQAARELVQLQDVELQVAINGMNLVWIRIFPEAEAQAEAEAEAQLIYEISSIFQMPWGQRTMQVDVDEHGKIQEGSCSLM